MVILSIVFKNSWGKFDGKLKGMGKWICGLGAWFCFVTQAAPGPALAAVSISLALRGVKTEALLNGRRDAGRSVEWLVVK